VPPVGRGGGSPLACGLAVLVGRPVVSEVGMGKEERGGRAWGRTLDCGRGMGKRRRGAGGSKKIEKACGK
jgi:hypothetical protein